MSGGNIPVAYRWTPLALVEAPLMYLWGAVYTVGSYLGLDVLPEPAFAIRIDGWIDEVVVWDD